MTRPNFCLVLALGLLIPLAGCVAVALALTCNHMGGQ